MKPRANASRRVVTAIVPATVAILLPAAACAGSAGNSAPARPAAAATVSTCNHFEVWLGLGNGDAGAGSVRYPIDGFSFPTCKKIGIMSVGAVRSHTGIPSFTAH